MLGSALLGVLGLPLTNSVCLRAGTVQAAEWEQGMFAVLARLQVAAVGDASFAGGATGGFVNTSDEGSQALSSALSAASGGGVLGMSDSAFASKLIISPELIAREKSKAKQGFCETALWNCTDLCELPHDCVQSARPNASKSGLGQHAHLLAIALYIAGGCCSCTFSPQATSCVALFPSRTGAVLPVLPVSLGLLLMMSSLCEQMARAAESLDYSCS